MLSVRWFPSPRLPRENGVVEWNGLGGHVTGWMIWYCVVSFVAGGVVVGAWVSGFYFMFCCGCRLEMSPRFSLINLVVIC
jgi:hypothetical protein